MVFIKLTAINTDCIIPVITHESNLFVRPSSVLAYTDRAILLHTGWIEVKETALEICQQIYSSEE